MRNYETVVFYNVALELRAYPYSGTNDPRFFIRSQLL